jgi:Asp-tRNA(Asn)/Glu-tRNA(Gln) amidotransferase A subunit family amidase
MPIEELVKMAVAELVDAYAAGDLSPVEVLQPVLEHSEAVNPSINALFSFRPEQALATARASEARWKAKAPLSVIDGVPMTVKDSVAMAGWPYTHGIRANRSQPPSDYDSAPAVALREAGVPIFAKTTWRKVEDIARLLTVLARQDERDTWSLPSDGRQYHKHLDRNIKGLRIGVLTDMGFGMKPEQAVLQAVLAAGDWLAEAGARVEPFVTPLNYDAYAAIDLFLQVRGFVEYSSLPSHNDGDINPFVRDWCLEGANRTGAEVYCALGQIDKMKKALLAAFAGWRLYHRADHAGGQFSCRGAGSFAWHALGAYDFYGNVQPNLSTSCDFMHGL